MVQLYRALLITSHSVHCTDLRLRRGIKKSSPLCLFCAFALYSISITTIPITTRTPIRWVSAAKNRRIMQMFTIIYTHKLNRIKCNKEIYIILVKLITSVPSMTLYFGFGVNTRRRKEKREITLKITL